MSELKRPPSPSLAGARALVMAGVYALGTGLSQTLAEAPAWRSDSPLQLATDAAVAAGLAGAIVQAVFHREPRRRWLLAIVAMLLLTAVQATDWLVNLGRIDDDWLIDLPLWLGASAVLRLALADLPAGVMSRRLWLWGLALQSVFIVLDLDNGHLLARMVGAPLAAALGEWAELLAIESYVAALALSSLVDADAPRRALSWSAQAAGLGTQARRLFNMGRFLRGAAYPPLRLAFVPVVRPMLMTAASVWLLAWVGPLARRALGRPLRAQLRDLLVLGLRRDFDPLSYYHQQLYRRGGRRDAAHYLTRHETKNGLVYALNQMRPQPYDGQEMGDKLLFADCCRRHGLAAVPILVACGSGGLQFSAGREALDRDLLCKPRRGRGAHGVLVFRRVACQRYRAPDGDTLSLEDLLLRLDALGRRTPLIVQPWLRNAAEVAALAEHSLVTLRVLTCLDENDRPVVTHGLLRVLSKLETGWPLNDEFGAPIDVSSGRLGCIVSDRVSQCAFRYTHHPVTGVRVEGRVLASWPAIATLATAAHAAFAHRILLGWDIGLTEEGPILLEGNSSPDVMFVQRAYGEGFGHSALGPLLQHHLGVLARSRGLD